MSNFSITPQDVPAPDESVWIYVHKDKVTDELIYIGTCLMDESAKWIAHYKQMRRTCIVSNIYLGETIELGITVPATSAQCKLLD